MMEVRGEVWGGGPLGSGLFCVGGLATGQFKPEMFRGGGETFRKGICQKKEGGRFFKVNGL